MKIFMLGGTGFVGKTLTRNLTSQDHKVTLLTRSIRKSIVLPAGANFFEGNPTNPGPWQNELKQHDVIINLVGASIFTRWNKKAKQAIYDSRINSVGNIVSSLQEDKGLVAHLINASAVGYYGFHKDEFLDESSPPGDDFLAVLVKDWEAAARAAEKLGVRTVCCRFGLVMGKNGGALQQMIQPFKYFLGSPLGSGRQWLSWVHEQDLADMILFLIKQENISGPVNCTSPNPVRNREITHIIGKILKKPVIIPFVPGFMLRIILGEFANVVVKGQRVMPHILQDNKFEPKFPTISAALQDLLG